MKSPPDDTAWKQMLREHWSAEVSSSSGFRPAVWARIQATQPTPQSWWRWVRAHQIGVGLATLLCLLSSFAGAAWSARAQVAYDREARVNAYIRSIDPLVRIEARTPTYHP